MEKPSFVRPFGWASVFRRTGKFQRFDRVASEERKPKDSFGWASEERKPKDSFGFVCELPRIGKRRTEVRLASETKIHKFVRLGFGGLLKNEKELRFINVFELKSTVSHFPDRIVSASLSWMIGSISKFQNVICNNEHIML
ncbi:hypothetical protein RIR_jg8017.t1 [Rhizophagus irregularis DAOM 181602=DAOM 197198]|nr:hypothetical protein RIR_jg8017.t1 [Rhizophagus irregularis DAOM 181602=DAOM 197198]